MAYWYERPNAREPLALWTASLLLVATALLTWWTLAKQVLALVLLALCVLFWLYKQLGWRLAEQVMDDTHLGVFCWRREVIIPLERIVAIRDWGTGRVLRAILREYGVTGKPRRVYAAVSPKRVVIYETDQGREALLFSASDTMLAKLWPAIEAAKKRTRLAQARQAEPQEADQPAAEANGVARPLEAGSLSAMEAEERAQAG